MKRFLFGSLAGCCYCPHRRERLGRAEAVDVTAVPTRRLPIQPAVSRPAPGPRQGKPEPGLAPEHQAAHAANKPNVNVLTFACESRSPSIPNGNRESASTAGIGRHSPRTSHRCPTQGGATKPQLPNNKLPIGRAGRPGQVEGVQRIGHRDLARRRGSETRTVIG